MRQIIRWLIIILLVVMGMAATLDSIRSLIVGSFIFTQALGMVLVAINIVAVVKVRERWITAAIISSLILLVSFILTSIESYSIAIAIVSVTLWYLITVKTKPELRNTPI